VESVPGRGSTFHFTIELGVKAAADAPERKSLDAVRWTAPRPAPALREIRAPSAALAPESVLEILLVEDNRLNQKLAQCVLRKHGHSVTVAENGAAALVLLERSRFDVVLMDVQMPHMDGIAATAAIRAREAKGEARRLPIIAMTACAMAGDRERCLKAGMDECLIKPVKPAALLEAVTRARQKGRDAAQPVKERKPVLDHAALLDRIAGDKSLFDELAGIFLADCPKLARAARDAIARCDACALASALHALRGMLRNLSAEAAEDTVAKLQAVDAEANPMAAEDLLSALEQDLKNLGEMLICLVAHETAA
jgi:CheY-like chemotaxis protein/HPt (histidine-containing phosphotransfer) domain-containing protein